MIECAVRPGVGVQRARRSLWLLEQALIVAAGLLAYFGVRGLTDASAREAHGHSDLIVAAERMLGIRWESAIQGAVIDWSPVIDFFNAVYIYGHWPVIAITLLWLGLRHRDVFLRMRNAMLASGGVGLVIFAAFPVAPPRLAHLELVDTVTQRTEAYRVLQPPGFTNQFAAMPSLHVGWNFLVELAIFAATTRVLLRVLAVVGALAMNLAVVVSANHFVLDAVAGLALAGAAWLVVSRVNARRVAGIPTNDGRQPGAQAVW